MRELRLTSAEIRGFTGWTMGEQHLYIYRLNKRLEAAGFNLKNPYRRFIDADEGGIVYQQDEFSDVVRSVWSRFLVWFRGGA